MQYTTLFVLLLLALLAGAFHAVKKMPAGYHLTTATVVDATKGAEDGEKGEWLGESGESRELVDTVEPEYCNEDKGSENAKNEETSQPCSFNKDTMQME